MTSTDISTTTNDTKCYICNSPIDYLTSSDDWSFCLTLYENHMRIIFYHLKCFEGIPISSDESVNKRQRTDEDVNKRQRTDEDVNKRQRPNGDDEDDLAFSKFIENLHRSL